MERLAGQATFLFIADTSGSMYGEKISAVNATLAECMNEMRSAGNAGRVRAGFAAFDERMKVLSAPQDVAGISVPDYRTEPAADGFYPLTSCAGLYRELYRWVKDGFAKNPEEKLYLFLITDGKPSDAGEERDGLELLKHEAAFREAEKYIALIGNQKSALPDTVLEFVNYRMDRIIQLKDLPGEIAGVKMTLGGGRADADDRNAFYESIFGR